MPISVTSRVNNPKQQLSNNFKKDLQANLMNLRKALASQYAFVSLTLRLHRLNLFQDRYFRDVVLDRLLQSLVLALSTSLVLIAFHIELRACLAVRIASFVEKRCQCLILRLSTEAIQADANQRGQQYGGQKQQQTNGGQCQTKSSHLV